MEVLAVDIWGPYAHYKKIFATTSAVSYVIPPKTTLYGWLGAVLGLDKTNYLNDFKEGSCKIGIQLRPYPGQKEVRLQIARIPHNLRPNLNAKVKNRKPTLMEFVRYPSYRLFIWHQDAGLHQELGERLAEHRPVYTPTLGLANLLANFAFVGSFSASQIEAPKAARQIHSVLPRSFFKRFDSDSLIQKATTEEAHEIIEQSMYALEMDGDRNVTHRDDLLIERRGKPIPAFVNSCHQIEGQDLILF